MNYINNLEAIIRQELIYQSGLAEKFVKNSLSLYGPNLSKSNNNIIFTTLEPTDNLLIFELIADDNSNNMSETDEDDIIHYYSSFKIHIIIYGDTSRELANTVISRLRTEDSKNRFFKQKIYLTSVSNSISVHDYINDSLWIRSDFDISISTEFLISQVENPEQYLGFSKINILTQGGSNE